jgi:GNAT superfamily N-acetyltransferase
MSKGKDIRRWNIHSAVASELPQARRLMPEVYKMTSAPDQVLVAIKADSGEMVGAAAIAWQAWGRPPGFPLYVCVAEPERRQGLGRALVNSAAQACRGETERFHNWATIQESAGETLFARAVGFDVNRRVLHFEADVLPFFKAVDAIYARLRDRGRIPSHATTLPLSDVAAAPVARLVSSTFGSRYDLVLSSIQGNSGTPYDRSNSVVLLVGSEVGGVLLCRWSDGVPEIDVRVVAPHLQGRWANLAMLRHITARGVDLAVPRFRFQCDDANADTISLARRTNAMLRRTTVEFSAPLQKLIGEAGLS